MKLFRLGIAATIACWLATGTAQAGLVINFDENGVGTVDTGVVAGVDDPQAIFPLTSLGLLLDPQTGVKTLAYDLTGSPGVGLIPVAGDIILNEPGVPSTDPNHISDILRFTNQGILYVYSGNESGAGPLADVGIPANFVAQANSLTFTESGPEFGPNGLFKYTPTANNPGFLPGGVVYNFTSDPFVPEPASLVLLGGGLAIVGAARRWATRR